MRNLLLAAVMATSIIAPLAAIVSAKADMFAVPQRGPRLGLGDRHHDWRRHDMDRERYWRWRHRHRHHYYNQYGD